MSIVLLNNRPEVTQFLEDSGNKLDGLQAIVSRYVEETCTGATKVKQARWIRTKSTAATVRTEIQRVNNNETTPEIAAANDCQGADRRRVDVRGVAAEAENILKSHLQEQGCRLGCSCVCHAHHHLQSPFLLDGLLGSLYIR